eukprot:gene12635-biopygen8519
MRDVVIGGSTVFVIIATVQYLLWRSRNASESRQARVRVAWEVSHGEDSQMKSSGNPGLRLCQRFGTPFRK